MRHHRLHSPSASPPSRGLSLFRLLLFAFVGLCWIGSASAQRLPPDPVEELGESLREDLAYPSPLSTDAADRKLRTDLLNYRKKAIEGGIAKLRSLAQMRQALLLQGWKVDSRDLDEQEIDSKAQEALGNRFKALFQKTLKSGAPYQQTAAIKLVGELAIDNQRQNKGKGNFVRRLTQGLEADLIKVIQDGSRDDVARLAAIRAVGKIYPDPKKVAEALDAFTQGTASKPYQMAAVESLKAMVDGNQAQLDARVGGPEVEERLADTNLQVLPGLLRSVAVSRPLPVRCAALEGLLAVTKSVESVRPLLSKEYPPKGRPRTPAEQRNIARDHKQIEEADKAATPTIKALEDNFQPLLQAVNDPAKKIHWKARRVVEDIAVIHERMRFQRENLPDLMPPGGGGEGQEPPVKLEGEKRFDSILATSIPALIQGIGPGNPTRPKLRAIQALERMGRLAEKAAPAVAANLRDHNNFVRWAAARALGKISNPDAPPPGAIDGLTNLLVDIDVDVREAAIRALGYFEPSAAVTSGPVMVIARELNNPRRDVDTRLNYMELLVDFGYGSRSAVGALTQALHDEEERIREEAARTLGKLGPISISAVPTLKEVGLKDKEKDVRVAACEALLNITQSEEPMAPAQP